ncbi:MAG: hypothetical protein IKA10_02520 [Oscillospiraceae bacterium]|nr:hypothetical protein [Oscillospiraceae bacterium]
MNFDSVNYSFLLQDFVFAMAAGFAAGGVNRFLSLFLYKGKVSLWIKDMLTAFVFAAAVFSYVVSFANYPDVRIYHLLGALFGFLSFNFNFSTIFHKFFEKIYGKIKNNILCCGKKVYHTICVKRQKVSIKHKKQQSLPEKTDLKNDDNWVYNL